MGHRGDVLDYGVAEKGDSTRLSVDPSDQNLLLTTIGRSLGSRHYSDG